MKFHKSFLTLLCFNSLYKTSFEGLLVEALVLSSSYQRTLQAIDDDSEVCIDDTTVNFTNTFLHAAFASQFKPKCTCTDTTDDMFSGLPNPNDYGDNTQAYVDDLNVALGQVNGKYEYNCENSFAICYDNGNICGLVTLTASASFQGREATYTIDNLYDESENIIDYHIYGKICILYTTGINGETCYSFKESSGTAITCTLSYNGEDCPCNVELINDKQCITSTCNGESIDNCASNGVDLYGPFGIIQLLITDAPPVLTVESDDNSVNPDSVNGKISGKTPTTGRAALTNYCYLHFFVLYYALQ